MPELYYNSLQKDTSSEIQQYLFSRDVNIKLDNNDIRKDKFNPSEIGKFDILSSPLHDRGHVHRETTTKKARAKESSKHFGVRFRPDLNKWVAEIRVAEWKTVDKKVWLGTFETEEGAARAVDAARKLLKCKKKRLPNFPCIELDAYSEQMPPNLNLNNLGNDAMFKDVTIFIKRTAQEYAASFSNPSSNNSVSVSSSKQVPEICEISDYSQPELPHINSQEDMSLDSQDSFPISCENWVNDSVLPYCEAEVADDHWQQLYDGDTISQWCIFDSVIRSFYKNDFSNLIQCNQDHEAIDTSHSSWEDQKFFPEEMDIISEDTMLKYSEPLLEFYTQDQTISLDLISEDEIMSYDSFSLFSELSFQKPSSGTVDSSMDWMLPQPHSHNYFAGLDCTQVY